MKQQSVITTIHQQQTSLAKRLLQASTGLMLITTLAPMAYALDAADDVVSFSEPLGAG